jgi:hypothetical protein
MTDCSTNATKMNTNRTEFRIGLPAVTTWPQAQGEASVIAETVRQVFVTHFSRDASFSQERISLENSGLDGRLLLDDFRARVSTMPQQGVPGSPPSGFSVLVSTEAHVPSVSKATHKADAAWFRVQVLSGAVVGVAILAAVVAVAYITGWVVLSTWYIVGVAAGAVALGTPISRCIANRAKRKSIRKASRDPETMRLAQEWTTFAETLRKTCEQHETTTRYFHKQ